MAWFFHHNGDVRDALAMGMVPSPLPLLLGSFAHKESGVYFEYAERRHPDDSFAPDMPHIVSVANDGVRLAKVLKSVAYVVVDENEHGPVIEKWPLRDHRAYDNAWVSKDLPALA
jgi:hypothetical protein